jgi:hypothetical protein
LILISDCKQLQENQAIAWFLKTKEKNPPKQETLDFLERIVHRVGETAENQRKTREKSKVAENQVFWLDFCAKKKNCAYPLWSRQALWVRIQTSFINGRRKPRSGQHTLTTGFT